MADGRVHCNKDLKSKEACVAMGKWFKDFHEASRKFKKDHPDVYEALPLAKDGTAKNFIPMRKPIPIEESEETFGLIHADVHRDNFFMTSESPYALRFFDWDTVVKDFYLLDIGSLIFSAAFYFDLDEKDISPEDLCKAKQNICNWICEGYTGGAYEIDKE